MGVLKVLRRSFAGHSTILFVLLFVVSSISNGSPGYKSKSEGIVVEKDHKGAKGHSPFNFEFSGEGEINLKNDKHRIKNQDRVTFYQFRLKPWVDRSPNSSTPFFEIDGAFLGFRYDESAQAAELMVAMGVEERKRGLGSRQEAFNWYRTSVYLAYNEDGSIAGRLPIMVRVDYERDSWDLYLYNRLKLTDLPLLSKGAFRVKTAGKGHTSIAGLRIGDANPLFDDDDLDGIDDEFSAKYPGMKRNDILKETGSSLLIEYLSRQRSSFHKKAAVERSEKKSL